LGLYQIHHKNNAIITGKEMKHITKIIDTENDSDFLSEVRNLMGLEPEDLNDTVISSDILLGMAEREIMKEYVPNWVSILNGEDEIAQRSLRSSVILKICLNILDNPMVQNYYVNEFRFIDIIANSGIDVQELRDGLERQFFKQLGYCGIVHSGEWPEKKLIGKSDSANLYDYYVDTEGEIKE